MWMTASIELILFSGVATSRDSNEWEYYVSASWVPYREHCVMRSFPLCGVEVLHLERMMKLGYQL